MYIFETNNPYIGEAVVFEKGQKALDAGFIADAILYFEAAVQQNQEDFEVCSFTEAACGWYD